MPHSLAGAFIFLAFLASAAPARSAQTLEGFGIFKFGLSPSQARALPGQSFGRYAAKNLLNQDSGAMASKISAKIYGVSYNFDLFFNSHQALNEISVANEITTSQGDCEIRFLTLLAQLEKSYGGLSPVYPQQKKNDQDLLPILVVWKSGAGASRYQLATVFLNDETAYVWNARKVLGARYLDAATFWSGGQDDDKAVCLTQIDFKA